MKTGNFPIVILNLVLSNILRFDKLTNRGTQWSRRAERSGVKHGLSLSKGISGFMRGEIPFGYALRSILVGQDVLHCAQNDRRG